MWMMFFSVLIAVIYTTQILIFTSLLSTDNDLIFYIGKPLCAIFTYYQTPDKIDDKEACNIGDYIQSLAVKQFCPNPILIDRDHLSTYSGPPVRLVMNGWFKPLPGNSQFSKKISALYVSIHSAYEYGLYRHVKFFLKKLRQYPQPVGCRDTSTVEYLTKNNIRAYWSACSTLTLGHTYRYNGTRENKIYFVDMHQMLRERFYKLNETQKFLKGKNLTTVNVDHFCSNYDESQNFERAKQYLIQYSKAALVVSPRLHVVLPCIAMGTPAILIRDSIDRRFSGLINFMNYDIYGDNYKMHRISLINDGEYIL